MSSGVSPLVVGNHSFTSQLEPLTAHVPLHKRGKALYTHDFTGKCSKWCGLCAKGDVVRRLVARLICRNSKIAAGFPQHAKIAKVPALRLSPSAVPGHLRTRGVHPSHRMHRHQSVVRSLSHRRCRQMSRRRTTARHCLRKALPLLHVPPRGLP